MTSRPEDTTNHPKTEDRAERPKPPTSLQTDTLQTGPLTNIPIVSPDGYRYIYIHTHTHMQTHTHTCGQTDPVSASSPQTDREKDPDYDSLPSQTSQSESSMLQVICRPEATNKEEAYTFHTVHSESAAATERPVSV